MQMIKLYSVSNVTREYNKCITSLSPGGQFLPEHQLQTVSISSQQGKRIRLKSAPSRRQWRQATYMQLTSQRHPHWLLYSFSWKSPTLRLFSCHMTSHEIGSPHCNSPIEFLSRICNGLDCFWHWFHYLYDWLITSGPRLTTVCKILTFHGNYEFTIPARFSAILFLPPRSHSERHVPKMIFI